MSYDRHKIDGIEKGVRVRYTGENGYDHDRRRANSVLMVDSTYVVTRVEVHDWYSDVWVEGCNEPFNSVMFEVVEDLH